jgi:hypothetical protein
MAFGLMLLWDSSTALFSKQLMSWGESPYQHIYGHLRLISLFDIIGE